MGREEMKKVSTDESCQEFTVWKEHKWNVEEVKMRENFFCCFGCFS